MTEQQQINIKEDCPLLNLFPLKGCYQNQS